MITNISPLSNSRQRIVTLPRPTPANAGTVLTPVRATLSLWTRPTSDRSPCSRCRGFGLLLKSFELPNEPGRGGAWCGPRLLPHRLETAPGIRANRAKQSRELTGRAAFETAERTPS